MKKFAFALVLTLGILFSTGGAFAQTVYTYPADDPVFAIAFPDDWDVELDEDDAGVIALSPDEEIEIDIWPLDAENVADDVREQIRMKIQQENLERQEELKAAEKLREEEEAKKAEEGKFGFFKKLKTS